MCYLMIILHDLKLKLGAYFAKKEKKKKTFREYGRVTYFYSLNDGYVRRTQIKICSF